MAFSSSKKTKTLKTRYGWTNVVQSQTITDYNTTYNKTINPITLFVFSSSSETMADEKFAVFAENMHCLLFWMERVTMLVYVFLSQHNAMLFTSLLFLFINEHYTYFNFYGVTSGYYTPKTIVSTKKLGLILISSRMHWLDI